MKLELCDMCKQREPNKKLKVKMSLKGGWLTCGDYRRWDGNLWQPYKKIVLCEYCYKKLVEVKV